MIVLRVLDLWIQRLWGILLWRWGAFSRYHLSWAEFCQGSHRQGRSVILWMEAHGFENECCNLMKRSIWDIQWRQQGNLQMVVESSEYKSELIQSLHLFLREQWLNSSWRDQQHRLKSVNCLTHLIFWELIETVHIIRLILLLIWVEWLVFEDDCQSNTL